MAFDFPASPTVNQTFTPAGGPTYTWNGYAWVVAAAAGSVVISDTPPPSAAQGNLWWESDSGKLYISFNDGNSVQWVAVSQAAVSSGAAGGGNVSNVGTPADNQLAVWTDSTHVEGSGASLTFDGTNFNAPTVTPSTDNSTKVATTAFVQSTLGASGFSTGDAKLTLKTVADSGWLMMNDGTIGSASSGATYANANSQALFNLLFANITDANCPIQTSTGAATTRAAQTNAATAWAANCRMTLPRALGRALAVSGAGAGLTARDLGQNLGEEKHAQSVAEMPQHNHSYSDPTHTHSWSTSYSWYLYYGSLLMSAQSADYYLCWYQGGYGNGVNTYNPTSISINYSGSTTPFNVMQPTSFWNVMIKL